MQDVKSRPPDDDSPAARGQDERITRLLGAVAGRNVNFEVEVLAGDDLRVSLYASGPVGLEVDYRLTPAAPGTLIDASITLNQAGGITGAVVSRAT